MKEEIQNIDYDGLVARHIEGLPEFSNLRAGLECVLDDSQALDRLFHDLVKNHRKLVTRLVGIYCKELDYFLVPKKGEEVV